MNRSRFYTGFLTALLLASSTQAGSLSVCANVLSDEKPVESTNLSGLRLVPYYLQKAKELNHLDHSAPLAVTLRAMIMSMTKEVRTEMIALGDLQEIHPISRPASLEKMNQRIEDLEGMPKWTWRNHVLSNEVINAYLPSKNAIRVIRETDGDYVVFDGNGRLFALKQVFPDTVKIEVEHYVSSSVLLQANLEKLLQTRGLR